MKLNLTLCLALATLLLALSPSQLNAQSKKYLDISQLGTGDYHLKVDASGEISVVPFQLITTSPSPNPPGPTPDPKPDPIPVENIIAKTFDKVATDANLPEKQRVEVSNLLTKILEIGITEPDKLEIAVRLGLTEYFNRSDATKEEWLPVRELLGSYWANLDQRGSDYADYEKLISDAALGIRGEFELLQIDWDKIDWEMILQIIKLVLDILA